MNKTFAFLILSAFLLIEHTLGKSIKTEETETSYEVTDSRNTFNDAAIAKLLILSEEPLKLGKTLIQDTYADDLDNESVKNFLTQILDDYRSLKNENPGNTIKLFLRLNVAFDTFNGTISDQKYGDKHLLLLAQEALRRHDKGVAIEFHKNYDEFLKWLALEIDANSTKFNSEEQLQINEFKNLCLQFKEETNRKRMLLVDSIVAWLKK